MPKITYTLQKPLFLLGFMASGKSTIGKILSTKLSLPYLDMDVEIEKRLNKKIKDIFTQHGEDFFRKYENNLLKELLQIYHIQIIAAGGGTPCYFDAMQLINQQSISIYLKLPIEEIAQRLKSDNTRPMLQGDVNTQIQKLFLQRESTYMQAKFSVDASQQPEIIADEIIFKLLENKY